jgi:hypothetical protein
MDSYDLYLSHPFGTYDSDGSYDTDGAYYYCTSVSASFSFSFTADTFRPNDSDYLNNSYECHHSNHTYASNSRQCPFPILSAPVTN